MAQLEAESVDTIITDPPYGLEFMSTNWDKAVPGPDFWEAALRVCKPGAMMLAFGGTRLFHRLTCAIEDAGWEIRDCLMWLYGSGFPKSHDISKAIDKRGGSQVGWFGPWLRQWREENDITQKEVARLFPSNTGGLTGCVANWELGLNMPTPGQFNRICKEFDLPFDSLEEAEREIIGQRAAIPGVAFTSEGPDTLDITAPATPEAALWNGWGTALKPAWEPIVLAMKPLDGTFAENALRHGVAGLNIDGGRIGLGNEKAPRGGKHQERTGGTDYFSRVPGKRTETSQDGRWPANLMLDEDTAPMLDGRVGNVKQDGKVTGKEASYSGEHGIYSPRGQQENSPFNDSGGASRFFYIAKPSKADRGHREAVSMPLFDTVDEGFRNDHPTVKPTPLMERLIILQVYLARLTDTPAIHQGGVILDPFGGSGTTAIAAKKAGRPIIIIERDKENLEITKQRLRGK